MLIPGFVFGFGRMGWRNRAKSREREGSALALTKPLSLPCGRRLGAPASRAALEHMAVMQQAIEHGAHRSDIAE